MGAEVFGNVEPGFENVAEVFEENFISRGEVGASCAIYVDGQLVVDLYGGVANIDTGEKWSEDTLQLVFSTTKGATALAANILIGRGELDPDEYVYKYWPEFKSNGKDSITVGMLMCHQAGLPYIEKELDLDQVIEWHPVVEALADQQPIWVPGESHGYHAITYGWLVGEVVRRASGAPSFGQFFANEVAKPLGLDFYIGLPNELTSRVSKLITIKRPEDEELGKLYDMVLGPDTLTGKALKSPSPALENMEVWNNPQIFAAEIPSANGITNAKSLAKMYASCVGEVDGIRLLPENQMKKATVARTSGADLVLFFPTLFGLGFMLPSQASLYAGPDAFGHDGAGGSHAWADSRHNIGFGYVMNYMEASLNGDPRSRSLTNAIYEALGDKPPSATLV
ncbi:MAG: beta-lactamase family protein [Acidimicrobiales bacterium]|nr:beta-lactamase family protein [Acidimicrobiales bacterium]